MATQSEADFRNGTLLLGTNGKIFTLEASLLPERAQAGRVAPRGFPKSNSFGPAF